MSQQPLTYYHKTTDNTVGNLDEATVDDAIDSLNLTSIEVYNAGPPVKRFKVDSTGTTATDLTLLPETADGIVLDVQNTVGTSVFNVDTSNSLVNVNEKLFIDHTDREALLVRKDADNGDIFKVDTLAGQVLADSSDAVHPSYSFIEDSNSGMYNVVDTSVNFAVNGSVPMFMTSDAVRIPQSKFIQFENFSNAYTNHRLYSSTSTNAEFIMENTNGNAYVIFQSNSGGVKVRPYQTSVANIDFIVQKGDGASSYTDVFKVDETGTVSNVPQTITADSTTAFVVESSGGTDVVNVDTTNKAVDIVGANANGFRVRNASGVIHRTDCSTGSETTYHFKPLVVQEDASNAFLVETAAGTDILNVDTSTPAVTIGAPLTYSGSYVTSEVLSLHTDFDFTIYLMRINDCVFVHYLQQTTTLTTSTELETTTFPSAWRPASGLVIVPVHISDFATGYQSKVWVINSTGTFKIMDYDLAVYLPSTGSYTIAGGGFTYKI